MREQPHEEPVVVTREVDLEVPADELWQLVADGERWAEWLTDRAEVVVEPASRGVVVDDDGIERQVAIDAVVPGERVQFTWWPSDRPGDASSVELVVAPSPIAPDRSRLSVVEIHASTAVAATARSLRWDVRLMLFVVRLDAVSLARRS
jgi:uncharacterized protein YndB with AHSA1/START domain